MQINKEKLTELSNQIETLLEGQGKDRLVLRVANSNEDFDIDEIDGDVLDELCDAYSGWGMETTIDDTEELVEEEIDELDFSMF